MAASAGAPDRVITISVRDLAERIWRRGDLHYLYDQATAAIEGQRSQQRAQAGAADGYQVERRVQYVHQPRSALARAFNLSLVVSGRIDGCDLQRRPWLLEEFKTTRQDPAALHAHLASVHWAQLRCYAGMLSVEMSASSAEDWCLRLVYLHPDHDRQHCEEERGPAARWHAFLIESCEQYLTWVAQTLAHRAQRDQALRHLAFPLTAFRTPQRTLARQVFQHIRDGRKLLVEAPTGIGKTLGTLYPALRSLGAGTADRVLFMTARNTGADAILTARHQLGDAALPVRSLVVTARQKACLLPEPECDPEICPYARGYYDRMPAAREALLSRTIMDAETVRAVAQEYAVCPFELSLDTLASADLVIADYNYAFDPVVRLQRLHGHLQERNVLLVDEAHQLPDRVRDMWSGAIDRTLLRRLCQLPGDAGRAAKALDRSLLALRREALGRSVGRQEDYEVQLALPQRLVEQVIRLQGACAELRLQRPDSLEAEHWFEVLSWARLCDWHDPERYLVTLAGQGTDFQLQLRCQQPAPQIAEVMAAMHTAIGFSGTLSPLKLFHQQWGDPDTSTLRLGSVFAPAQLGVFVINDIDVRLRRREASLPRLGALIRTVIDRQPGRYLVVLPSFAYLQQLSAHLAVDLSETALLCQAPDMDPAARAAFLTRLQTGPDQSLVACVVLGGIFAESVDLPAGVLQGMIVVGVGLPPPSLAREHLSGLIDETWPGLGPVAAYQQPAMTRVVQAAGRLIRRESDRAILCLVDDRFGHPAFQRYFPDFWRPQALSADGTGRALDAFWNPR